MLGIIETKLVNVYSLNDNKTELKNRNICLYKGKKVVKNNGFYFHYNEGLNTISKKMVKF